MKFILVILYLISFIFTDQNVKKCGMFIDSQNRDWDEYRPSLAESFLSSDGYFMIHFDRSGIDAVSSSDSDGDGIPNYIEEVESAAMYSKNLLLDMGYLSPISDVDCSYTDVDIDGVSVNDTCIDAGGFDCVFNAGDATDGTEEACDNNDDNGIYDIYILDMDAGYYGVNWPDEYILNASFVVIDNEYESADYGEVSGLDAMKVTVAHEFFHAVQRSYIDYQPISNQYDHDRYFMELSSTWFEDVAYPEINDYVNWGDYYINNPEEEISDYDPTQGSTTDPGYALALFGHYLTNIDEIIMRRIWQTIGNANSSYKGYVRDCISNILDAHGSSFADAWSDFNARNLFNGKFSNEYNHIYYYEDQKYFDPIETLLYSQLSGSLDLNNISNDGVKISSTAIDDQSIVTIIRENYTLDDFSVHYAIVSSNPSNHRIYHMNEFQSFSNIILDEDDRFHMLYTAYQLSEINLDMLVTYHEFFSFNTGDVNLDGTRSELDNQILIEYINEIMSVSQYQTDLLDTNNSDSINVADVIKLVNIILDE